MVSEKEYLQGVEKVYFQKEGKREEKELQYNISRFFKIWQKENFNQLV